MISLKRALACVRFRSPFIYVAHTRSNPDNEHCGLTTHRELRRLLKQHCFHTPVTTFVPLHRPGLPQWVSNLIVGMEWCSEHVVLSAQKSIFVGMYPD